VIRRGLAKKKLEEFFKGEPIIHPVKLLEV
jgi:hypothetical protein